MSLKGKESKIFFIQKSSPLCDVKGQNFRLRRPDKDKYSSNRLEVKEGEHKIPIHQSHRQ